MTYRVDAWMERVQPSRSYPSADRTSFEAEPKQLIPRHHPVLAIRLLADRSLRRTSLSLCPYIGLSDGLGGHAGRVASYGARMARTSQKFCDGGAPELANLPAVFASSFAVICSELIK